MTDPHWVKILADNWRGRNGNSTTGDSVRNSCADELERVAAKNGILGVAQGKQDCGKPVATWLWACTGCGSQMTMDQIKGEHPNALCCCPERRMAPLPSTGCGGGK
jgi:hypothetical protein